MEFKCPERILNNFESQRALTGMPIISAPGLSSADVWLFLILLAAPSFCIQHFNQLIVILSCGKPLRISSWWSYVQTLSRILASSLMATHRSTSHDMVSERAFGIYLTKGWPGWWHSLSARDNIAKTLPKTQQGTQGLSLFAKVTP